MPVALLLMRKLVDMFQNSFADVSLRSIALLDQTADETLFQRPRELPQTFAMFTIGEYILRSAATVEQAFGGLTTRLWDDPFEWTLPEKLNTVTAVKGYLAEVEETTQAGFEFLANDDVLFKEIPAPSAITPIAQILIQTLARAEHFQGRAFAVYQMLSDEKLPKI